jgi:hypothetical protein
MAPFDFKGAYLASMLFNVFAGRFRRRSNPCAINVNMFQLLSRKMRMSFILMFMFKSIYKMFSEMHYYLP